MTISRLPGKIYFILAVIFPKITKKGAKSIKFEGQIAYYFKCSGNCTQIPE